MKCMALKNNEPLKSSSYFWSKKEKKGDIQNIKHVLMTRQLEVTINVLYALITSINDVY